MSMARAALTRIRTLARQVARAAAATAVRMCFGPAAVRRRVPPEKLIASVVRAMPDRGRVARASITHLKGIAPINVPALISGYIDGLLPFGMYYKPGEYYWDEVPDRGLITLETASLSKSVRRQVKRSDLEIRFDSDVETIIRRCRRVDGTWINEPIIGVLLEAADLGLCTTIGAYRGSELVAGEFGLDLRGWYVSMSTFYEVNGAGNALLARVVHEIAEGGRFVTCDVGVMKEHSRQFGARAVMPAEFEARLMTHLASPRRSAASDPTIDT